MRPEVGDTSITLPVTLDFKGGRSTRSRTVLWATIIIIIATILILVFFWLKSNKEFLLKLGITIGIAIVELRVFCIFFFKERYLKKIYEDLQASDGKLDYTELWKIFEIDAVHPHICYFKNGKKGIFVRMERGTITGKGEDASFYHYDAIAEAYNAAHSANLDIIHIDYMSGIGQDRRIDALTQEALKLENNTMRETMLSIYDHLMEDISVVYSCFDVYLFLTNKGSAQSLFDGVQTVCEKMLGGNYISYTCMSRDAVSTLCRDVFNLEFFDSVSVSQTLVDGSKDAVVPIAYKSVNGEVTVLNKTHKQQEEERRQREHDMLIKREQEEMARKARKLQNNNKDFSDLF